MRFERLAVAEWPADHNSAAVSALIGSVLVPASGRIEQRYSSDYGYDNENLGIESNFQIQRDGTGRLLSITMQAFGSTVPFYMLPEQTRNEINERLIDDDGEALASVDDLESARSFMADTLVFAIERSAMFADFDRFFVAGFYVNTFEGGSERVVLADSYPDTQYADIDSTDNVGLEVYLAEMDNSSTQYPTAEEVRFIVNALKHEGLIKNRELIRLWATLKFPTLTARMYQSIVGRG